MKILAKIIALSDPFFVGLRTENIYDSAENLLKLALRSLVSVVRLSEAQSVFMEVISTFDSLVDVLERTQNEEIVANSLKVIRLVFREKNYLLYVANCSTATINKII